MMNATKYLLTLLLLSAYVNSYSQVDAGDDVTISAGIPLKLNAVYEGYTGLPITAGDDSFVGPFEIGFEFTYFGEVHSQFAASPNGIISLDVPDIINVSVQEPLPIPNGILLKTIMGPYQDLFKKPIEPHSEFLYYLTVGEAPARRLIVGWCDAPMYSCESERASYQIVLNEEDNSVTNHVLSKPYCNYNQNKATQGVNNNDNFGVAVDSRNNTSWTASSETWLFEPDGPESYTVTQLDFNPEVIGPEGKLTWAWYANSTQSDPVSTSQSIIVYPVESTTYIVEISLCGGHTFTDEIYVKVIPLPNAFNPDSEIPENRVFKVIASSDDNIFQFRMNIYDRWGQLVFETNNPEIGWDGTKNGTPCNPGVYVWTIFQEGEGGDTANSGSVTLVR
ncbi:MAG: gliding motility-associated C-terminal domain-containing protein [Bacteroidales bacterium]